MHTQQYDNGEEGGEGGGGGSDAIISRRARQSRVTKALHDKACERHDK